MNSLSDSGVGDSAEFDPSEIRLIPTPAEPFPMPDAYLLEYKLEMGRGKEVGVAGRDGGVGMELTVVVVLILAPERRDCGRRTVLCASGGFEKVGEDALGIPWR